MKVLLYSEGKNSLKTSGIGKARTLQMKALDKASISYTTNINDTFDIVHINTLFKKSYKLMLKMQKRGFKVISHGHSTVEDFEYSFAFWRLIKPWFKKTITRMYSHADYIITPSSHSKRNIEKLPISCPIQALSNGIDLDDYKNVTPNDIELFKTKYNLKDEKTILGVGLFFERKGIHDFIEVARNLPDYKFIWFGHLNPLLTTRMIRKTIRKRPNNVIMAGYSGGNIIKAAFKYATAVLFPSYEENEGIVVLEALASKTPLIVRDIDVYSDWLEHRKNCYKGSSNDEFVALIKEISTNRDEIIISNGYKVIEERSIDKIGIELGNIYNKVINKNG